MVLDMAKRFVTHEQARRFYDRIGRGQDARPLSERRALDALGPAPRLRPKRDASAERTARGHA